jgi:hypothetical protein
MSVPISILLFGTNTLLLEARMGVLQSVGYRASIAPNLSALSHMLREKEVDLLILCHSLSMEDRGRALAFTYRWPMMRSLVLTAGDDGCRGDLLSAVRDAVGGPAELAPTAGKFFHVENRTDVHVR